MVSQQKARHGQSQSKTARPLVSVVIPTYKRAALLLVVNRDERTYCVLSTDLVERGTLELSGSGHIDFHVPCLPLCGGQYYIHAAIENETVTQDWVQYAAELQVLDGDFYGTGKQYPHEGWRGKGMFIKHTWSKNCSS